MADVAVKDVAAGKLLFVFEGIELGCRVDDVQFGVCSETLKHQNRRFAAQGADFHDPPRPNGIEYRC